MVKSPRLLVAMVAVFLAVTAAPTSSGADMPARNGKLVFMSTRSEDGSYRLYLVDPETLEVEGPIDPQPGIALGTGTYGWSHNWSAVFSPDGERIAWSYQPTLCQRNVGCVASGEIWVMDADGSNPVRVTHEPNPLFDDYPAWSPDGTRIIYTRGFCTRSEDLYYVDELEDGVWSRPTFLYGEPDSAERPGGFSPDGEWFYFSKDVESVPCSSERTQHWEIFRIRADGSGAPTQLTRTKYGASSPRVSPNGKWVTFFKIRVDGIWVMRPDGSDLRRLTRQKDVWPIWSPDGKQIAFTHSWLGRWWSSAHRDIYVINFARPHRRRVIVDDPGFDGLTDWQPLPQGSR